VGGGGGGGGPLLVGGGSRGSSRGEGSLVKVSKVAAARQPQASS
jgi:hypothetical protein